MTGDACAGPTILLVAALLVAAALALGLPGRGQCGQSRRCP
jgi:hypothetical protein